MASNRNRLAGSSIAMCALLLLPTLGLAQPTMRVAAPFEDYCEYSAVRDVLLGQVFDIVVVLDSDGQDVSYLAALSCGADEYCVYDKGCGAGGRLDRDDARDGAVG